MVLGYLAFLNNLVRLRAEQWRSPEEIQNLQSARLGRTLDSALSTSFYSKLFGNFSLGKNDVLDDLSLLPLTEKSHIHMNPRMFVNKQRGRLISEKTSGSTGTPMEIFFDPHALRYRDALAAQDQLEFGRRTKDLYLEISQRPIPSFPLSGLGIFRKITLSVFEDERTLFSKMLKARPDILGWYPSVTSMMAKLNREAGKPLKLKSVFSGAELLTSDARSLIEDSFSCPVFDQYASTEFGVMAWECPEEHSLHVNSNSMMLEIVDKKGKPIKSGTGRIAVTGLYNHAMPLLRYSIGDLGSWGKECPCGRALPVLKSINGRDADTFTLPSGRVVWPSTLTTIHDVPGIRQYQIIHKEPDLILFRYVADSELGEESLADVKKRILNACHHEQIRLEFERADSIPRNKSGKFSYIISKVK